MHILRAPALFVAAFALSACQTAEDTNPHAWSQLAPGPDFDTAFAHCLMQRTAATPPNVVVFGPIAAQVSAISHNSAMQARGDEIYRLCMRSLGWALVPVYPQGTSSPTHG